MRINSMTGGLPRVKISMILDIGACAMSACGLPDYLSRNNTHLLGWSRLRKSGCWQNRHYAFSNVLSGLLYISYKIETYQLINRNWLIVFSSFYMTSKYHFDIPPSKSKRMIETFMLQWPHPVITEPGRSQSYSCLWKLLKDPKSLHIPGSTL